MTLRDTEAGSRSADNVLLTARDAATNLRDPHSSLCIASELMDSYSQRVASGREKMQFSRVVICGLARNVAEVLPATIARVEQLGSEFADYRVVIFENDSTDDTLGLLFKWQCENSRVQILAERFDDPVNPVARCVHRGERMARYRNAYREFVAAEYHDFDYGIVIDTDLKNGWHPDGVASSFSYTDWDFIGSNGVILKHFLTSQRQFHQDAWAFRTDTDFTSLTTWYVNRLSWPVGSPLVPVNSCFGGLGLYRMQALVECEYAGGDCEHVGLHRDMFQNNMRRLFLNPSQIVDYGQKSSRMRRFVQALLGRRRAAISASDQASFPQSPSMS